MNYLISYANELLGKLTNKSSSLNWKVEDVEKDVSTLKCGFDSLKEDVAVLESASSELLHLSSEIGPCLEEHNKETEQQLPKIKISVEDQNLAADKLEEFSHPCGGAGWKLAIYRDFRDPNTSCPDEWERTMYDERPYTCGKKSEGQGCDIASFPETEGLEYSKVCGRIKAYQFGTLSTDHSVLIESDSEGDIWTFTNGITQSQTESSLFQFRCPCDGGQPFSSETHFCESLIKDNIPGDKYDNHFFSNNVLWDNVGCSSSGDCCSRFVGPYFIRHLESMSTDPISVTICTADRATQNYAIELIEIYVQ